MIRFELIRRWVPRPLRHAFQRYVSLTDWKLHLRRRENPLRDVFESDENRANSPLRFAIVYNAAQYHRHFVQACLEIGVPFRVVDLYRADWLEQVKDSGCEVLLVWPDAVRSVTARLIKDRVEVLERYLAYPCVPSSNELWMYEDKCRTAAWLAAHRVPTPATWIFSRQSEAEEFAAGCQLPMVVKTSFGAAASGVWIARRRRTLKRLVRAAFRRGLMAGGGDPRDRQWGSVVLQEYLADVREWRLVRIGESYFGHPKGRVGEFHSGSGVAHWDVPEPRHLDFLHAVTEAGGFRSMDVDVFETPDGRLLANELQAVFGASVAIDQCRVDGRPGRFVRLSGGRWEFEAGDFARNACANERIRDALARGLRRSQPV